MTKIIIDLKKIFWVLLTSSFALGMMFLAIRVAPYIAENWFPAAAEFCMPIIQTIGVLAILVAMIAVIATCIFAMLNFLSMLFLRVGPPGAVMSCGSTRAVDPAGYSAAAT